MIEIATNTQPNSSPVIPPSRSFWAEFTSWISDAWDATLGVRNARERRELATQTQDQLQKLAREAQATPRIIRDLEQARKSILTSPVALPEWHAMLRLRDPRGQIHDITYDPKQGSKWGFGIDLPQYRVGFAPVGDMNGYNTHFSVRALPKKEWSPAESWEVLAIRFSLWTPEFQSLEQERLNITNQIHSIEKLQKIRAQELIKINIPLKPESAKTRIAKTRRIWELRSSLDASDKLLASQKPELDRVNRALQSLSVKYREITYSPYHTSFNTSEVRRAGFNYLTNTVQSTWAEPLRAKYSIQGLDTIAWSRGTEAWAAIDPRIGVTLAMVERMDFVPYLKRYNPKDQSGELKDRPLVDAMMREQLERALATLGANGANTYTYQRNARTQAAGIAQITPEGQGHMIRRYGQSILPALDFVPDHTVGPSDPVQSLRFMQVHLIDQISVQLPGTSVKSQWSKIIANESTQLGIYGLLAAGYNGSMSRVVGEALGEKAFKQSPKVIYEKLKLENIIQNVNGNMETLTYVIKFDFVWRYLQAKYPEEFKALATPKTTK